ncbi:MAG: FHA domain-containing protein [Anaerolineae bacterium]|nr:FHA domain-containing protein [Anaerolineae bacterium]
MASETAMLLMVEGPTPGKRIFMDQPVLLLGRDERCDVEVPDRQVSRHHASITIEDDRYILRDLNSKNGTFLNGQEVDIPRALHDGDEIQIAYCCKLTFVGADATAPVILGEAGETGLRLERESKRVWVAGAELDPPLSLAQYRLLALLYDEPGRVYSRDDVVEAVWPADDREGISEQAIDALARRLRERLAEADPDNQYVVTVRGHGFRLENAIKDT